MALTIRVATTSADVEWASDLLWGLGVVAIEEIVDAEGGVILRTSMGEDETVARRALAALPATLVWSFEVVDDESIDSWREHVRAFEVGESLTIVPAWDVAVGTDVARMAVTIEPGATFGMGDHPTTRGCLQLLERIDVVDRRVLDVGCGSGILGVVAIMRGARSAHGIDINPASVEVSRRNAIANGVDDRWTVSDEFASGEFDVVFANILAPVLIELADEIGRRVAGEGTLILSGILDGRYEHVLAEYADFVVIDRVVIDGWATLRLTRG